MILDWHCPSCNVRGSAVVLRGQLASDQVLKSHTYHQQYLHRTNKAARCAGAGLRWEERIVIQPRLRR